MFMIQKQPPWLFSKISVLFFREHFFLEFSRSWTYTIFPGTLFMCSPNGYRFSRSIFLATEQITIFQKAFFEYQRTDRQFPGRYPLRTDISSIALGGCFRWFFLSCIVFILCCFFVIENWTKENLKQKCTCRFLINMFLIKKGVVSPFSSDVVTTWINA